MNIIAKSKSVKVSTRKVRLVGDAIRNKSVDEAQKILLLTHKHGSYVLAKTLQSAIANAVNNAKVSKDNLHISGLEITEGPFLKRFHAGSRGFVRPYKKRTSHIVITLSETKKEEQK